MRHRRTVGVVVFALLLLTLPVANAVGASAPSVAPALPLSQLEQAARLSGLASQALRRKIFPRPVEAIAPPFQLDYQAQWPSASRYGRTIIGEQIGNQGLPRFATDQGWGEILGPQARGIVQGPDAVYWDHRSGLLRPLEAKGGTSQVKWTFNSRQGTNTNAIQSAEFVLKSAKASPAEKLAAARVIKAAEQHRLQTGVVRTSHGGLGKPDIPRLEGKWDPASVSEEAFEIERRLVRQNPELAQTFRTAGQAQASAMLKYRASQLKYRAGQGVAILGLAGAGVFGWDAYQQSREAWSMFQDPTLRGAALPYMQTGIAAGRLAEAMTLGLGSATHLGLFQYAGFKVLGQAAGKWFLPIAVGVEGLSAGMAYYEYSTGRINQRDFYRRSTGPAIFAVFTTGGAIIGGLAGASAGGVGAVPGAAAGAGVGALVAVPVQFAADWTWNWYYRKFDEQQRRVVDMAVERFYGL